MDRVRRKVVFGCGGQAGDKRMDSGWTNSGTRAGPMAWGARIQAEKVAQKLAFLAVGVSLVERQTRGF